MNTTPRFSPRPALGALLLASFLLAPCGVVAGPIDPPAGPIAPTGKTLAQVEPRVPVGPDTTPGAPGEVYRIAQPGSYYLTGDVVGAAGLNGIRIVSPDVTLDLNGFAVVGAEGSFRGIDLQGELENVKIRNGVVRGWGNHGIDAYLDVNCVFEGLRVVGNGRDGINAGDRASVVGCVAEGNAEQGLDVGADALLRECTAVGNALHGIRAGEGARVIDCVARGNGTPGQMGGAGIETGDGARVTGSSAVGNQTSGIHVGSDAAVSGCVATENLLHGIRTGPGATVSGCAASGNQGAGIYANIASTVTACTTNGNTGHGIDATERSTVAGCTALGNGSGSGAGIRVFFASTVTGCTIASSSVGVLSEGGDNRIDGNNIASCTTGIRASAGSVVVRNTISGSTAPISQEGPAAIGEVLNVVGSTISSSSPWANLVY